VQPTRSEELAKRFVTSEIVFLCSVPGLFLVLTWAWAAPLAGVAMASGLVAAVLGMQLSGYDSASDYWDSWRAVLRVYTPSWQGEMIRLAGWSTHTLRVLLITLVLVDLLSLVLAAFLLLV
jgi:hypothetical protein